MSHGSAKSALSFSSSVDTSLQPSDAGLSLDELVSAVRGLLAELALPSMDQVAIEENVLAPACALLESKRSCGNSHTDTSTMRSTTVDTTDLSSTAQSFRDSSSSNSNTQASSPNNSSTKYALGWVALKRSKHSDYYTTGVPDNAGEKPEEKKGDVHHTTATTKSCSPSPLPFTFSCSSPSSSLAKQPKGQAKTRTRTTRDPNMFDTEDTITPSLPFHLGSSSKTPPNTSAVQPQARGTPSLKLTKEAVVFSHDRQVRAAQPLTNSTRKKKNQARTSVEADDSVGDFMEHSEEMQAVRDVHKTLRDFRMATRRVLLAIRQREIVWTALCHFLCIAAVERPSRPASSASVGTAQSTSKNTGMARGASASTEALKPVNKDLNIVKLSQPPPPPPPAPAPITPSMTEKKAVDEAGEEKGMTSAAVVGDLRRRWGSNTDMHERSTISTDDKVDVVGGSTLEKMTRPPPPLLLRPHTPLAARAGLEVRSVPPLPVLQVCTPHSTSAVSACTSPAAAAAAVKAVKEKQLKQKEKKDEVEAGGNRFYQGRRHSCPTTTASAVSSEQRRAHINTEEQEKGISPHPPPTAPLPPPFSSRLLHEKENNGIATVVSLGTALNRAPCAAYVPCVLHFFFYLQQTTVRVVEEIAAWRDLLTFPQPFIVEQHNYLLEVLQQVASLAGHEVVCRALNLQYAPGNAAVGGAPASLAMNAWGLGSADEGAQTAEETRRQKQLLLHPLFSDRLALLKMHVEPPPYLRAMEASSRGGGGGGTQSSSPSLSHPSCSTRSAGTHHSSKTSSLQPTSETAHHAQDNEDVVSSAGPVEKNLPSSSPPASHVLLLPVSLLNEYRPHSPYSNSSLLHCAQAAASHVSHSVPSPASQEQQQQLPHGSWKDLATPHAAVSPQAIKSILSPAAVARASGQHQGASQIETHEGKEKAVRPAHRRRRAKVRHSSSLRRHSRGAVTINEVTEVTPGRVQSAEDILCAEVETQLSCLQESISQGVRGRYPLLLLMKQEQDNCRRTFSARSERKHGASTNAALVAVPRRRGERVGEADGASVERHRRGEVVLVRVSDKKLLVEWLQRLERCLVSLGRGRSEVPP